MRNYFNRSDVQAAINAPPTNFYICQAGSNLFPQGDQSAFSGLGPLPSVIERTNNTIIGHGLLDFLLFANASLITIQNMTWNGMQGFQERPSKVQNFFVPYHQSLSYILRFADEAVPNLPQVFDTAGAGFQVRHLFLLLPRNAIRGAREHVSPLLSATLWITRHTDLSNRVSHTRKED